jgi:hypothetical protein
MFYGNHGNQIVFYRQHGNRGNQVGLDCLRTIAIKLFTRGNHGNYDNQAI